MRKIKSALVSVFNKEGLEPLVRLLHANGVKLYSTGGTQSFIEDMDIPVTSVESQTEYPSVFGGRVKTLHPAIFGGILYRRDHEGDEGEKEKYNIPALDLVVVDLYPFEDTVAAGASHQEIIEKIDIGGISLIRAAAKNFSDVLIVSSRQQYGEVVELLEKQDCSTNGDQRKIFAREAFEMSSHYDSMIFRYFNDDESSQALKVSYQRGKTLRYGENPHQKGLFYGKLEEVFEKLNGKEISYNNLVDVEAAVSLAEEFSEPVFVIVKHTNACGISTGESVLECYEKALAADPISAFGGILATNQSIDRDTALKINDLFYEVLIAPYYEEEALEVLKGRKNRILFRQKQPVSANIQFRSLLNGVLLQEADNVSDSREELRTVTKAVPAEDEIDDLLFASKVAKHTKSNTIVLARHGQLLASGVGQTSRVDALKQAIEKARGFGFDLNGAVMASDAFFPFPDCVEIAHEVGVKAVIQPGGSVKDQDSIDFCDSHGMSMVFTGRRHFKH